MPDEMRDAFGHALVALGEEFPEIVVLDADLNTSSKTVYFKERFPRRFIQCGIAEQNMFGIAAGLALQGFIPFPSTFAVFAAKRALDQISISICYPQLNVKIPGSYVGLPTSRAGASHNAVEDLATMRAVPHLRVADPGDNRDLVALMRTAVETPGPVYFRITRYTLPDLFPEGHVFRWGEGQRLREGGDVTLVGTGMMTSLCLKAAEILEGDGLHAEVLHCGSVKPLDEGLVASSARKTGAVVTAENASMVGGLGAAVAEVLAERRPAATGKEAPGIRDIKQPATAGIIAVTAVEPSAVMRAQRPPGAAPCVAAAAESLPFEDQSFDAAMAFSTIHHWHDPIAGLREMRRVTGPGGFVAVRDSDYAAMTWYPLSPGMDDWPNSSVSMYPHRFTTRSGEVWVSSGFALVPMATTTRSQSTTNSDPSTGTGRRRPEASGSPSSIRTQRSPVTQPSSSPTTSTGAVRKVNRMPSCSAWWTSSARAGSSARDRR